MSTAVLLSIKPIFANAIFAGEKTYEFRKSVFKNKSVNKIYIYASAPVSRVIGYVYIEEIIENPLHKLWKETQDGAGISQQYFKNYFSGRKRGYALKVEKAYLYKKPRDLESMFGIQNPPQSFRYVPKRN